MLSTKEQEESYEMHKKKIIFVKQKNKDKHARVKNIVKLGITSLYKGLQKCCTLDMLFKIQCT